MPRKQKAQINVPDPRRLPSGNWNIQLRLGGKSISITDSDAKACYARAVAIKAEHTESREPTVRSDITLREAIDKYIAARSAVLSPSTIRGYRTIQRNRFPDIMSKPISAISKDFLQKSVNAQAPTVAPKTLRSSAAFISSVIHAETGARYDIALPPVMPRERPFLTPDEVEVFRDAIKGSKHEVACLLGLMSCRCSEILGLRWQDVDLKRKVAHIRRTRVRDANHHLVVKSATKNASSTRDIPLTARLVELLTLADKDEPYVYNAHAGTLRRYINRVCRDNGLPEIGIHGLRHSFASLAYHLKIPAKVAQEIGGWSDDHTMMKIYTHIAKSDIDHYESELTAFFDQN